MINNQMKVQQNMIINLEAQLKISGKERGNLCREVLFLEQQLRTNGIQEHLVKRIESMESEFKELKKVAAKDV